MLRAVPSLCLNCCWKLRTPFKSSVFSLSLRHLSSRESPELVQATHRTSLLQVTSDSRLPDHSEEHGCSSIAAKSPVISSFNENNSTEPSLHQTVSSFRRSKFISPLRFPISRSSNLDVDYIFEYRGLAQYVYIRDDSVTVQFAFVDDSLDLITEGGPLDPSRSDSVQPVARTGLCRLGSEHSKPTEMVDHLRRQDIKPTVDDPSSSSSVLADGQWPRRVVSAEQEKDVSRRYLLRTMAITQSDAEAWDAYSILLSMVQERNHPPIPFPYLHRLARLISVTRPRTRTLFLRLFSVLSHLRRTGGNVALWEWNALIDFAGRGWRKIRDVDYANAIDIFQDFLSQANPKQGPHGAESLESQASRPRSKGVEPDIITYTTLLNIASRTRNMATLRQATALFKSSQLPPNRLTHLSLMTYYTETKNLSGVRSTLVKMKEQNLELGIDGINAALWAFARNDHMDIASTIYRVLRHNIIPELVVGEYDIGEAKRYLVDFECLDIPTALRPDQITYNTMIQSFAYHGDLVRALQVFEDMLSVSCVDSAKMDLGLSARSYSSTDDRPCTPTLTAFRSIFLGFTRHAGSGKTGRSMLSDRINHSVQDVNSKAAWNLHNLSAILDSFLAVPATEQPNERTIYWILQAFMITSDGDNARLREVWSQLVEKYGGGWGGRVKKIGEKLHRS